MVIFFDNIISYNVQGKTNCRKLKKDYFSSMLRRILIIVFFLYLYAASNAQQKGIQLLRKETDTAAIDFNRRFALVIGNAKYEKDSLRNPVNDANRVAALLEKYGFKVMLRNNLSRGEMNRVINEFGDSITTRKGVSFFFYSGHGFQYNAQNYLLPLKTSIEKETEIEDEAVKLAKLLDRMRQTRNGLNVVILDACRNNPFYEKLPSFPKGLTDKETLPGNTSVLFATTPGNIALDGEGNNSPFTEALTEAVTDSIEFYQVVRKVVKQVKAKTKPVQQPAITGSPEDEFYFTPKQSKPTLHLLSIGISNYNESMYNLKYARKDAMDITITFRRQEGLLYENINVSVLTDDAATKVNILEAISQMKKKVKAGDVIMLYLSGHIVSGGSALAINRNEYDAIPLNDSTLQSFLMPTDGDFRNVEKTGVNIEHIRSLLADMPCKSVLFIDGSYNAATAKRLSTTENGVAVFAGTSPDEHSFAIESDVFNNGVFTYALMKGISGAADKDKMGFVDLRSLQEYIRKEVTKLTNNMQIPTAYFPSGLSNFPISKSL